MSVSRFDISPLTSAIETHSVILVPNHRIRQAIIQAYSEQVSTDSWRSPEVYAIDIWLKHLWRTAANLGIAPFCEFKVLDSIEEQLLWTTIIEKSSETIPLLNPEETALEVSRAYQQMQMWLVAESDKASLNSYAQLPDIAAFLQWKNEFQKRCDDANLISLVDCTQIVISEIDSLTEVLPAKIVLSNFLQPPPLYQQLFDQLRGHCQVNAIGASELSSQCPQQMLEYQSFDAEVIACASWAKAVIASEPTSHIGILFDGAAEQEKRLLRLFHDVLRPEDLLEFSNRKLINRVGSSERLSDAPLIHDAFVLLGLNSQKQESESLCRLLKSPHTIAFCEENQSRLRLELQMRRNFTATCSVSDFTHYLARDESDYHSPALAAALLSFKSLQRQAPKFGSSLQWAELFTHQLELLGWPGDPARLRRQEKALLQQWSTTLERFSQSGSAAGSLSVGAALSRLRMICHQVRQEVNFDARCQLSLLKLNDASGFRFNHLWVLGMDDQSWPPAPNPTAFLPYQLQKEARIPESCSDLQFQLATETFEQLQNAVSNSFSVSFHREDGDQQLRPSQFLQSFKAVIPDAEAVVPLNRYSAQLTSEYQLTTIEDCLGVPVTHTENPGGGQAIISDQASCPFRAFAIHRLAAEPLEEFSSGLSKRARGTAIHIAMEFFYQQINSKQQLEASTDTELSQLISDAAQQAVEYLGSKYREVMTPKFQSVEQRRIEHLLHGFVEQEKQRADFTIKSTEEQVQFKAETLELNLKVDRIDMLADGSIAVIDYKTGKATVSVAELLKERPADMQLPVYYAAVSAQGSEEVSSLNIGHLNAEKIGYSGIVSNSEFHPKMKPFNHDGRQSVDWQELTARWLQTINNLSMEFSAGFSPVSPVNRPGTCQYCHLQGLCRIGEIESSVSNSVAQVSGSATIDPDHSGAVS